MVDRVIPLGSAPRRTEGEQVLWVRLPDGGESFNWFKKLLNMFPGENPAVVYLADSKKKLQTHCILHDALLAELRETLGEASVVLKEK